MLILLWRLLFRVALAELLVHLSVVVSQSFQIAHFNYVSTLFVWLRSGTPSILLILPLITKWLTLLELCGLSTELSAGHSLIWGAYGFMDGCRSPLFPAVGKGTLWVIVCANYWAFGFCACQLSSVVTLALKPKTVDTSLLWYSGCVDHEVWRILLLVL